MREFPKREVFQPEIDKANKHPLNQAALKALEKTPGYDGPAPELHVLDLLLWAIEERLVKVPEAMEHTILKLAGPNPERAMELLTHDADDGEVDLVSEANDPTDPKSLAVTIMNHLMSHYWAANPPISNE